VQRKNESQLHEVLAGVRLVDARVNIASGIQRGGGAVSVVSAVPAFAGTARKRSATSS